MAMFLLLLATWLNYHSGADSYFILVTGPLLQSKNDPLISVQWWSSVLASVVMAWSYWLSHPHSLNTDQLFHCSQAALSPLSETQWHTNHCAVYILDTWIEFRFWTRIESVHHSCDLRLKNLSLNPALAVWQLVDQDSRWIVFPGIKLTRGGRSLI